MAEFMIPYVEKFKPKRLDEVKRRFGVSTGTFEFIFEMGQTAEKLVSVLSARSSGYSLGEMERCPLLIEKAEFVVEKHDLFKSGDESGPRVGVLEIQKDKSGNVHAVFLGVSDREAYKIAAMVRSSS